MSRIARLRIDDRDATPAQRASAAEPRCASAGAFFVATNMNPDLERLIALQRLDSAAHDAERRSPTNPSASKALDAQLEAARQQVAAAKERLAENQNARRAIEKDVAVHQGRLSKFRDQLMAVKTNQSSTRPCRRRSSSPRPRSRRSRTGFSSGCSRPTSSPPRVKRAEAALAAEQKSGRRRPAGAGRRDRRAEGRRSSGCARERAGVVAALDPQVLAIFELVSRRRNGVAVAEARDGICTICHVRLRPQVFNTVRRNERDHPVRQLPADPVLHARADSRRADAPRQPAD